MGEISLPVLFQIVIFLLVPLLGGIAATRLKLPTTVGYIVGGLCMGIFLEKTVSSDFLSHIAGIGIIFLLFTVGLEMDVKTLSRFGKFVVWGGLLQIAVSAFFILLLSLVFGFSIFESILLGLCFALSSTAVAAKMIQEKGEENSLYGALAIGILIFQDMAAIPLLVIADTFSTIGAVGPIDVVFNIFLALLKAGVILVLISITGRRLVPFVFTKVGRLSREILNLFTIFFIFSVVYAFSHLGLSAAVAAFISGALIAQTHAHYHIFSQIRPLRDLFAILFFVFLGASINIATLLPQIPSILLFTVLLVIIKIVVILVLFVGFRFHTRTSFSLALGLSHVGEFAFLIVSQVSRSGAVLDTTFQFAVAVVLASIIISPILFTKKDVIYSRLRRFIKKFAPALDHYIANTCDKEIPHLDALSIKDHIIICGYGRVGSYIGRALTLSNIPFIAIDYNYYKVEYAKKQGVNILYGDPTHIDILDYAQCENARSIVSCVAESYAQESIVFNAKRLNPNIVIFSRVDFERDLRRLKDLGAHLVIQPEFEAAISIIRKIFATTNMDKEEIVGKIKRLKLEHGMA